MGDLTLSSLNAASSNIRSSFTPILMLHNLSQIYNLPLSGCRLQPGFDLLEPRCCVLHTLFERNQLDTEMFLGFARISLVPFRQAQCLWLRDARKRSWLSEVRIQLRVERHM